VIKKKIAVVTGSRAEYGILKPLLEKIKKSPRLELNLIVTGMHLLKKYGMTINEIKKDGFSKIYKIPMYVENESKVGYHANSLSSGIEGFTTLFSRNKPDILVVFGDRLEPLAATLAASTFHIPIAHIHGGDKTESGHIDESIRNAISQFAHIHFTATKKHKERLVKMGQDSWRVHQVGALGLDSIVEKKLISKKDLFNRLKIKSSKKTAVCIFHPVESEIGKLGIQMNLILKTLRDFDLQSVILYPNNDDGSKEIISVIKKYEKEKKFKIFNNLSHLDFISLIKHSDVLIGNSSSGFIEAPFLGTPVINVLPRNKGREHHPKKVFFVEAKAKKIKISLKKSLNYTSFRKKAMGRLNPYGNGNASNKILRELIKRKTDYKLLQKIITI